MSSLTKAVDVWATSVEGKFGGIMEQQRSQADELSNIREALLGGREFQTPKQKAYSKAFGEYLQAPAGNELKLQRAQKDVVTGTDMAGGYALPSDLSQQIYSAAYAMVPHVELIGIREVSSTDYKEPIGMADQVADVIGETGARTATAVSTMRAAVPTWGEIHCLVTASNHAVADIGLLREFVRQETSRQIAVKLGTDLWSGNGSGTLTGILNTTPSADADSASPQRTQYQVQYVPVTSSPQAIGFADIENLLAEFQEEYLADPSFAIVMRRSTWNHILNNESVSDAVLTMPRAPSLWGIPVRFSSVFPAATADAYPVAAGAWRRAYTLTSRGPLRIVTDRVTTPGWTSWHLYGRHGGCVRDCNALKLLKLSDS